MIFRAVVGVERVMKSDGAVARGPAQGDAHSCGTERADVAALKRRHTAAAPRLA